MEKRALLAFILTFAVLILWPYLFQPNREKPPEVEQPGEIGQETLPEEEWVPPYLEKEEEKGQGISLPIKEDVEREMIVENSLYRIKFSNRGGVVTSWRLKEHMNESGDALNLISSAAKELNFYPLQLKTGDEELDYRLSHGLYEMSLERATITEDSGQKVEGQKITFRYADGKGLFVEKVLEIPDGRYLSYIRFSIKGSGIEGSPSLIWGPGFGQERKNSTRFYYSGQALANVSGRIVRIKKVENERMLTGGVRWAGLEDQYFSAIFIPQSALERATILSSSPSSEEGKKEKYLSLCVPQLPKGYALYVGPKDYHILSSIGYDLKYAINFGSISIIALFAKGLFFSLIWLYEHIYPNYGLAIIIVTMVIRILFFPLTQKSFVSMKKMQTQMQKLQPKINAIKTKYRKKGLDFQSRQKMNQEIMDLYKKEGINPMGGMTGCLPLLLQLPILWAFYNVLSVAIELRQAPFFLWIKDLSVRDPIYVTPILMGATMLIQQVMSGPTGGDPFQRRMMYMMPLIFTFFFLNFPSGLVLYWLVNNVLGIGQQYLINKQARKILLEVKRHKKK